MELPEPGAKAILRRGQLEVSVEVVWKAGCKAGVTFSSAVQVADWMPRAVPSHQRRVDEMIRHIRAGGEIGTCSTKAGLDGLDTEAELQALRRELQELENQLSTDPATVAAHPEIQLLDVALQRVGRLLANAQPGQS